MASPARVNKKLVSEKDRDTYDIELVVQEVLIVGANIKCDTERSRRIHSADQPAVKISHRARIQDGTYTYRSPTLRRISI